jgi:hypothetical protein
MWMIGGGVPALVRDLLSNPFGDKGCISQPLLERLWEDGIQLITKLRKDIKERLVLMFDKLRSRKRAIVESILDQV